MKTVIIFNDVVSRIKKSLNIKSDRELSTFLGMAETTFNGRKKAQSLPFNEIFELAFTRKLNLDWLFFGIYPQSNHYLTSDTSEKQYDVVKKEWSNFDLVPFYDIEASAGHGSLVDHEQMTGEMAFRKDWLAQKGLIASQCALIKARGDSMEPTINDGDLLLVDTRINAIKDDSIYILQADEHLTVKRVQKQMDGRLLIISDNPCYQTNALSAERAKDVKVIGRLRWYGHEI